jgi:hypothetical protein
MLVVVLNDCVTETNETPSASKISTSLAEVRERAGEPIDFVDHHHINQPGADRGEKALQGGPLERPAREAAIVKVLLDQAPALRGLALHIGSRGFPLRIERVEVLLKTVVGRDSGVDRTAQGLRRRLNHPPLPF